MQPAEKPSRDALFQKISKARGFDSVDTMLKSEKARPVKLKPKGYAGGGLIDGVKNMLGMKTETVTEKFARQDAEFRAKHPQPAAPASAPAKGNTAIGDYAGMTAMQKREKAAGLKAGGMVKKKCVEGGQIDGPGGPTDDLVPIMASNGEFMIKASSAKILGPELLEALNDVGGKEESEKGDKLKTGGMVRKPVLHMAQAGSVAQALEDQYGIKADQGYLQSVGDKLKSGIKAVSSAGNFGSPEQTAAASGPYSDPSRKLDIAPTSPAVATSPAMPTMGNGYRGKSYSDPRDPSSNAAALNDPASNASILAQNPAGAVRKVGNSYSGSNVSGNVGFVGADGNPISGRPGGGFVQVSPQATQSLANPDGSQWSASDNAIMAENIRDGIDPTRGTSRGQHGGASIIGGPAIPGGDPNDLLSANHEAMRRANIAATRSGYRPEDKAMRAAGVSLVSGLGQQFGQAKQDQQANARTAMTTQATQAQTDATSRNQANANQIAQAQLGLNRQKQTQDNALARDKLAADTGMEKIKQQLWAAYTNGTPEQKVQAAEQLQMMNGKDQSGSRPFAVPGGQGFNADGTPYTIASSVFDPSTKQFIQQGGQSAPKAPPKAGDTVSGYKFKGGNPADQKNWEKV